ncbi:hypothetical protein BpHYR1_008399 [Brachionus plicatilis]|uniref:Uncharacterized protein n=1 Tax=Brachionus plicatilis TaxID=10195 RepID=A0A3M7RXI3_BRAPC|nr:hypothetical protein BpHYR1_008399 [Brachionus plicatilis]
MFSLNFFPTWFFMILGSNQMVCLMNALRLFSVDMIRILLNWWGKISFFSNGSYGNTDLTSGFLKSTCQIGTVYLINN